jgi:tetratricopeptide (TPR) repeat protein
VEHRLRHHQAGTKINFPVRLRGFHRGLPPCVFLAAAVFTPWGPGLRAQTPAPSSEQIVVTSPAAAQFDRAQALLAAKKYAEALLEFSSLIKTYPNDSRREEALYRLADCYRLLGKTGDALAAFNYFLEAYPSSLFGAAAGFRKGEILYQRGKFAEAIPPFSIARNNGDATTQQIAAYYIARCQLHTGETAEGQAALRTLAEAQPGTAYSAAAALALADSLETSGKPEEALALWKTALSLSGDAVWKAQAAARGGWTALQLGKTAEAEALFEQARTLDAEGNWRRIANTGLLRLRFQQKNHGEVTRLYNTERARFLESARNDILFQAAHSFFELRQYAEAVPVFDLFLAENKTSAEAPLAAYERLLARAELSPANIAGDTAAFLAAYPDSPWVSSVQFLRASDYSRRRDFSTALPMWEKLALLPPGKVPQERTLHELARAYFETQKWPEAAAAFARFAKTFPQSPLALSAAMQQAVSLQNAKLSAEALAAWQNVRAAAPAPSPENKTALEQLGLLLSQERKTAEAAAVFRDLLKQYPDTRLRAFASFTIGATAFDAKNYAEAEPALLQARTADAETWAVPAGQRLALLAYARQDLEKATRYAEEYGVLGAKTKDAALPADLFFWLGQGWQGRSDFARASHYFRATLAHPGAKELLPVTWWKLASCQSELRQWKDAVDSYTRYRQLQPEMAEATKVLLALGRAHVGAGTLLDAQRLAEQVLLQEPEGPNNAAGRMLLADALAARKDFAAAAKAYAALSLIYEDALLTPRALARAAECYERAGDAAASKEMKEKLKARYPAYKVES